MKKSTITFEIQLDEGNIPEKISWSASDRDKGESSETKSISLALWDQEEQNTLRIDLWTKDMYVEEMRRFYVDALGGMAQSLMNATGDGYMADEINALCDKLAKHVAEQEKKKGAGQ